MALSQLLLIILSWSAVVSGQRAGIQVASAVPAFSFRLGQVGCASSSAEASSGYSYALAKLAGQELSLRDSSGRKFRFVFQYEALDGCTRAVHRLQVANLIDATRVHFALGAATEFADDESSQYNAASRLLLHCCAPDSVYERDLPYVYGVQPPSRLYGTGALRYAVLSGSVRHLALLYRTDDPYSTAVCEGILTAAAGIVRELVPGLKLHVRQYSAANVTAASAADGAVFYRALARGAMAAGVDGVAACDTYAESGVLAGAFIEAKYYLKAFFLSTGPNTPKWVNTLGPAGEGLLGAALWHPSAFYSPAAANATASSDTGSSPSSSSSSSGDATTQVAVRLMGSSRSFLDAYRAATGAVPGGRAAAAAAAVTALAAALSTAFSRCDLSRVSTADELLFGRGLLDCDAAASMAAAAAGAVALAATANATTAAAALPYYGPGYWNVTGYELVIAALQRLHIDESFFGPIAFDSLRRNSALTPLTLQIHDSAAETILPLEAAGWPGTMPAPNLYGSGNSSDGQPPGPSHSDTGGGGSSSSGGEPKVMGSLTKEAAITVLVLSVVVAALMAFMALLLLRRRRRQRRRQPLEDLVAIAYTDLTDIRAPLQVMSGFPPDYETGYAKLKGQYVALRPLVDYYSAGRADKAAAAAAAAARDADTYLWKGYLVQRPRHSSGTGAPPPTGSGAAVSSPSGGAGACSRPSGFIADALGLMGMGSGTLDGDGGAGGSGLGRGRSMLARAIASVSFKQRPRLTTLRTERVMTSALDGAHGPVSAPTAFGVGGGGAHGPVSSPIAVGGCGGAAHGPVSAPTAFGGVGGGAHGPVSSLTAIGGGGGAAHGPVSAPTAVRGGGGGAHGPISAPTAIGGGGGGGVPGVGGLSGAGETTAAILAANAGGGAAAGACVSGAAAAAWRLRRASTLVARTSGPLSVGGMHGVGVGPHTAPHVLPGFASVGGEASGFAGGIVRDGAVGGGGRALMKHETIGSVISIGSTVAAAAAERAVAAEAAKAAATAGAGPDTYAVGGGVTRHSLQQLPLRQDPFPSTPFATPEAAAAAGAPSSCYTRPAPQSCVQHSPAPQQPQQQVWLTAALPPAFTTQQQGASASVSLSLPAPMHDMLSQPAPELLLQPQDSAAPPLAGTIAATPFASSAAGHTAAAALLSPQATRGRSISNHIEAAEVRNVLYTRSSLEGPQQPRGGSTAAAAAAAPAAVAAAAAPSPRTQLVPYSARAAAAAAESSSLLPPPPSVFLLHQQGSSQPPPPPQPPSRSPPAQASPCSHPAQQGTFPGGSNGSASASAAPGTSGTAASVTGPETYGSSGLHASYGGATTAAYDGRSSVGSATSARVSHSGFGYVGPYGVSTPNGYGMSMPPQGVSYGGAAPGTGPGTAPGTGTEPSPWTTGHGGPSTAPPLSAAAPSPAFAAAAASVAAVLAAQAAAPSGLPPVSSSRLPRLAETATGELDVGDVTVTAATADGGPSTADAYDSGVLSGLVAGGIGGGTATNPTGPNTGLSYAGPATATATLPAAVTFSRVTSGDRSHYDRPSSSPYAGGGGGFGPMGSIFTTTQSSLRRTVGGVAAVDSDVEARGGGAGGRALLRNSTLPHHHYGGGGGGGGPGGLGLGLGLGPEGGHHSAPLGVAGYPSRALTSNGLLLASGGLHSHSHMPGGASARGTVTNGGMLAAGAGGGSGGGRRFISSKKQLAHIIWRLTRLQHPNVLPVLGIVWDFAGLPVPVLVTQYEEFGSLSGLLDNSTVVIDVQRRLDIVNDVANALRYLYAQDDLIFNGLLGATNWRVYLDKRFKAKVEVTIASIALESPVFCKGRGTQPAPTGGNPQPSITYAAHPAHASGPSAATVTGGGSGSGGAAAQGSPLPQLIPAHGGPSTTGIATGAELAEPSTVFATGFPYSSTGTAVAAAVAAAAAPSGTAKAAAGAAAAAAAAAPAAESAEPEDVYQFGLMVLTLFVESPVSLLGPSPEQLETVRGLHPVLGDVVEACTAAEAAERPAFADIAAALNSVVLAPPPPNSAETSSALGNSKRMPQGFKVGGMSEEELYEAFPPSVAEALKAGREPPAEPHEEVSIFFSDIVGYTNHCSRLATHEVMDMLNRLYSRFDALIKELDLFKVDVIGDAYLAVGNIRRKHTDHARRLLQFAFRAIEVANSEPVCVSRPELGTISIRVGLHVGPVMACVVGTMNRRYSLFGNTVNVASRMESTGEPNKVQCTSAYKQLVRCTWPEVVARSRGFRNIKGKGLMETYFLYPPDTPLSAIGPSLLNDELATSSRASSEGNLNAQLQLPALNLKRFQTLPRQRALAPPAAAAAATAAGGSHGGGAAGAAGGGGAGGHGGLTETDPGEDRKSAALGVVGSGGGGGDREPGALPGYPLLNHTHLSPGRGLLHSLAHRGGGDAHAGAGAGAGGAGAGTGPLQRVHVTSCGGEVGRRSASGLITSLGHGLVLGGGSAAGGRAAAAAAGGPPLLERLGAFSAGGNRTGPGCISYSSGPLSGAGLTGGLGGGSGGGGLGRVRGATSGGDVTGENTSVGGATSTSLGGGGSTSVGGGSAESGELMPRLSASGNPPGRLRLSRSARVRQSPASPQQQLPARLPREREPARGEEEKEQELQEPPVPVVVTHLLERQLAGARKASSATGMRMP